MLHIRPGDLRHEIIIESTSDTLTNGELIHSWSTFTTVRAKVETKNATETDEGVRFYEQSVKVFTIRYFPGLTPKMRISWNSDIYEIQGVEDVQDRNVFMKLYATLYDPHG